MTITHLDGPVPRCRTCGVPIGFHRLKSGKWMPVTAHFDRKGAYIITTHGNHDNLTVRHECAQRDVAVFQYRSTRPEMANMTDEQIRVRFCVELVGQRPHLAALRHSPLRIAREVVVLGNDIGTVVDVLGHADVTRGRRILGLEHPFMDY